MTMKGMEVEKGLTAAQRFASGAEEINQFGANFTNVLNSFEWLGPDADRTRETWNNDYMNMLRQVSQAMETFSTLLNNQAREQQDVSA